MQRFSLFTCLMLLTLAGNSKIITSRTDGSWDDKSIWDCKCIPTPEDEVLILHRVEFANPYAPILGLTISNTGQREASLKLSGGSWLDVRENLKMESDDFPFDVTLKMQKGKSRMHIGGNVEMTRTRRNYVMNVLSIEMNDFSEMHVTGDFNYLYYNSNSSTDQIMLNQDAHFVVLGNMLISMQDGVAFTFDMNHRSSVFIGGNLTAEQLGGSTLLFHLADEVRFLTGGNLTLNNGGGESLDFRATDLSDIRIMGNFKSSLNLGDRLNLHLDGEAIMSVVGNFEMNQSGDGEGDMEIRMNNDFGSFARLNITRDFIINKTGGDKMILRLDQNSSMNVTGEFTANVDDTEDLYIYLGKYSNSSLASMNINGDMKLRQQASEDEEQIHIHLYLDTRISVTGAVNMNQKTMNKSAMSAFLQLHNNAAMVAGSSIAPGR